MTSDLDFVRSIFAAHDPAGVPRHDASVASIEVLDSSRERGLRTGKSLHRSPRNVVALSAAAAVVVIAASIMVVGRTHGRHGASTVVAAAEAPATFDHVRYQDWANGKITDTLDHWVNGSGYGRITETTADGRVTRDQAIVPVGGSTTASASAAQGASSASPAPRQGIDAESVDYPGIVPSEENALRAYLSQGEKDHAHLGERLADLVFARNLSSQQVVELVGIAKSIATAAPSAATTPSGQAVELIALPPLPASAQWWLAISADETQILGLCYDRDHELWRLQVLSEATSTTN